MSPTVSTLVTNGLVVGMPVSGTPLTIVAGSVITDITAGTTFHINANVGTGSATDGNVAYHPPHHLVPAKGPGTDAFVMVAGYPAETRRWIPAADVCWPCALLRPAGGPITTGEPS